MAKRLLLISNSTMAGEEYLGWPRTYISDFLKSEGVNKVTFVPYAGVNLSEESLEASYDVYLKRVADVFGSMGFEVESVHKAANPVLMINEAEAIAVGGGNTFHLVAMMHQTGIMDAIRGKAERGTPYMGWSAGANVACPSLKTTNDMPIIEPASFDTLGLVPFQINPHYLDANPEGHGGETREQRIEEFLVINREMNVVGLREASLLFVEGKLLKLLGSRDMRLFRFGTKPVEYKPGSDLSFLL
ncbi:MAG: dipeptidase PepE [Bacteroidetes bacterium]|nr:MAG: dipeptidase PepE [Bacteroidota bacterium]RLD43469.1 MAG: dipeptidase PepE [Bacteroidota bacterium]RLD88021.1 MAG: dipeptidase PepE [Bacteroidota bacterium]HHL57577.1 dipeptidase PepE [Bacteroidota bacterium]